MNKNEALDFLIHAPITADPNLSKLEIPKSYDEKRKRLRSFMNIRPPYPISNEFIKMQDEFLEIELAEKGIIDTVCSGSMNREYPCGRYPFLPDCHFESLARIV